MNAPLPLGECIERVIPLHHPVPPILAMGAWFKNTLCITSGQQAFISNSMGDLDTPDACRAHERTARVLLDSLDEKPHVIAHDLHPDFHSSRFAAQLAAADCRAASSRPHRRVVRRAWRG